MEYYIAVIILLIILLFINLNLYKSNASDDMPGDISGNMSGDMSSDLPALVLPSHSYDQEFAETSVSNFDACDTIGLSMRDGVGGGEAPQLTENAVESPEYRRQMKSLIDHLLRVGYKKNVVNSYINLIKDKHLSPQLILMQLKNDAHAPPPNVSEAQS